MLRTRVIPVLLLQNGGLVKGEKFKKHKYVGDPINAVRIFNEKEVDELVFLDISATNNNRDPDYSLIEDMASEAFMPMAYGGGVKSSLQVERLFRSGVEKVIINSRFYVQPDFVRECSQIVGAQSIVVSMDVKRTLFGRYEVYAFNGSKNTEIDPITYARKAEEMGAGELILTSIDREGTNSGFDLDLIQQVANSVNIPLVAHGGASSLSDFKTAVTVARVSAVAAGSYFTFHGKHKAVLLTYPTYDELEKLFSG
jgi:imidazole glycerol-phosphate synthase subunit HisF